MIVFCEDCGEKNLIDDSQIGETKIRFRCNACNYLNTVDKPTRLYAQKKPKGDVSSKKK